MESETIEMQKKLFVWGVALLWIVTLLYFVFRAKSELTWNDLGAATLSAAATLIWIGLNAQRFTTWRALGLLLLAHLLTQVWLQWQWDLWGTRWENVNAVGALLALDTFAAILVVSALLLIRRDASVWALAVVWLGCPLGLLLSMSRYPNMAQIETLPLRDSTVMLAVVCLLGFLALGGILAFCAHFLRLIYLELAGKT